jgi:hypothetical protein
MRRVASCQSNRSSVGTQVPQGRLIVAQHAVLGYVNPVQPSPEGTADSSPARSAGFTSIQIRVVPKGRLSSFLDLVHGKKLFQFVREADPLVMFDLSLDIFHSGRSLRDSD